MPDLTAPTYSWPQHILRELIESACAAGSASAKCASPREAELLRYALYSFRRSAEIGRDISITIDGSMVVLSYRQKPKIEIQNQTEV